MATIHGDGQGPAQTTGVGMMDCKQALSEPGRHAGSDRLAAQKGLSKVRKKPAALPRA